MACEFNEYLLSVICRYMRNKPTIIAFKTPSLENAKARKSTSVDMGLSKIFNQKDAEEGVVAKVAEDGKRGTNKRS